LPWGNQDNFILIAGQSKLTGDSAIGFNLRSWQQIRLSDTLSLTEALMEGLEHHYSL